MCLDVHELHERRWESENPFDHLVKAGGAGPFPSFRCPVLYLTYGPGRDFGAKEACWERPDWLGASFCWAKGFASDGAPSVPKVISLL